MAEMAPRWRLDAATSERLHRVARAEQWGVSVEAIAHALERGVHHAFGGDLPEPSQLERHLASLRLEELALACACAAGHEAMADADAHRVAAVHEDRCAVRLLSL